MCSRISQRLSYAKDQALVFPVGHHAQQKEPQMNNPITIEEVQKALDFAVRLGLIERCPHGHEQSYTPLSSDYAEKLGSRSPQ
jgi:hypothetical protein